jgi:NADH:ubiquinone oxidoreductase subunit H
MMIFALEKIISLIILILPILLAVAFLTLAERKIMASIQQRLGPDAVGFTGALQPLSDAIKLILKEAVIPTNAHTFGFIIAPILSLFLSLTS